MRYLIVSVVICQYVWLIFGQDHFFQVLVPTNPCSCIRLHANKFYQSLIHRTSLVSLMCVNELEKSEYLVITINQPNGVKTLTYNQICIFILQVLKMVHLVVIKAGLHIDLYYSLKSAISLISLSCSSGSLGIHVVFYVQVYLHRFFFLQKQSIDICIVLL